VSRDPSVRDRPLYLLRLGLAKEARFGKDNGDGDLDARDKLVAP
jgi:hypothetical protein